MIKNKKIIATRVKSEKKSQAYAFFIHLFDFAINIT